MVRLLCCGLDSRGEGGGGEKGGNFAITFSQPASPVCVAALFMLTEVLFIFDFAD